MKHEHNIAGKKISENKTKELWEFLNYSRNKNSIEWFIDKDEEDKDISK